MDFIFANGFAATADNAFTIFERGRGGTTRGANGGFKVAAIIGEDAGGLHTYAPTIITVGTDSYSNGGAGVGLASRYDVYRGPVGSDLDTLFNDNLAPQGIAGVLISLEQFGTSSDILGYSILPMDVTGNSTQISDWTDTTFFSRTSNFTNDVDLVASGALVVTLIPEPSALGLSLLSCLVFFRRQRK